LPQVHKIVVNLQQCYIGKSNDCWMQPSTLCKGK